MAGDATLFVSYGGKIQRSSEDGRLTYVGEIENRLVKVRRSTSLRELRDKLAAVAGCFNVTLQYARPDYPDELRDVVTDDDVRHMLDWVLLRDLQIQQYRANPEKVVVIPRVRVIVVSMDVRPPLPEWLFAVAPTTPSAAPSPSPAPPAKAPVSPSPLQKRSASAPSLSWYSADDTSNPPSPSPIQRSASASRLTRPSTNPVTTTTSAASSTRANQEGILHYATPFPPAMQQGLQGPAPVFLVPVAPIIVYQPVIHVYQGFLVPAGCRDVVVPCAA